MTTNNATLPLHSSNFPYFTYIVSQPPYRCSFINNIYLARNVILEVIDQERHIMDILRILNEAPPMCHFPPKSSKTHAIGASGLSGHTDYDRRMPTSISGHYVL